jgi:hypothetical protein
MLGTVVRCGKPERKSDDAADYDNEREQDSVSRLHVWILESSTHEVYSCLHAASVARELHGVFKIA